MLCIFAVLFACSVCGAPVVIDFEADTTGLKANGFSATGFPGVTFSDTLGANLS
jgi:hypothetical protein